MSGLTVEEQARAAAAKARATAIERIYNTRPPDYSHVKLTVDEDLYRGFKEGTLVLLCGQTLNPATPRPKDPQPDDWMYRIKRYIIAGPKYQRVHSPLSGNQVITSSSLTLSRDRTAGPVPLNIPMGSKAFLLKDVRWGQGNSEVSIPKGTPCRIKSRVSRVGSGQPARNVFQVTFWWKFYEPDFDKYESYVRWSSLRHWRQTSDQLFLKCRILVGLRSFRPNPHSLWDLINT